MRYVNILNEMPLLIRATLADPTYPVGDILEYLMSAFTNPLHRFHIEPLLDGYGDISLKSLPNHSIYRNGLRSMFQAIYRDTLKYKTVRYSAVASVFSQLISKKPNFWSCSYNQEIVAIGPDLEIYPCQAAIGDQNKVVGKLDPDREEPWQIHFRVPPPVFHKDYCKHCWARYFCGGGCYLAQSNSEYMYRKWHCGLIRRSVEEAVYMFLLLKKKHPETFDAVVSNLLNPEICRS